MALNENLIKKITTIKMNKNTTQHCRDLPWDAKPKIKFQPVGMPTM